MKCTHGLADMDVACADGICPLCSATDRRVLIEALKEISKTCSCAIPNDTRWLLGKIAALADCALVNVGSF